MTPARDRAGLVLAATSINVVLVFISASSIAVLLPEIARTFDATPAATSWFVLGYQLVMTSLIVVFGRLADIFGRKALYVFGVGVFIVASAAAGLVGDSGLFVVARLLQGLGAAAIIGNTTAILTDVFPRARLGHALGLNATAAGLGQVLGPAIAGVVTEFTSWQWIFLATAPLAATSVAVSARLIPSRPPGGERERIDVVGMTAFATSLSAFSLAMSLGPAQGWDSVGVWALIALSVGVLGGFVLWQRRASSPLIDLALFRVPGLGARYLAVLLCAFSQNAVVILISQYLQGVRGLSVFELSALVLASPAANMIAASSAGRLLARFGALRLAATGMLLIASSSAMLIPFVLLGVPTPWVVAAFALLGLGVGLFMTPNTSLIMTLTPAHRRGVSNAIRSTLMNVGALLTTAVGLAVSTSLLSERGRHVVYAGRFPLSPEDSHLLSGGTAIALGVMFVAAVTGAWLSLRRAAS